MKLHFPLNPATGLEDATQLPWSDGVPETGQEGSYPPSAAVVEPMTELANLLDQVGITKSSSDLFQVTRAVRSGQLDFDATDIGTADAVICQIGLAHTQIIAGLPFTLIKGPNANTGNAVPTLTITDLSGNNGLTGTIVKAGGGALKAGDLPANALITVRARAPGVFAVVSLLTISDVIALIQASTFYGPDTSTTVNVITAAIPNYGSAWLQGRVFQVKVANALTGASTINVNGIGAVALTRADQSATKAGDAVVNEVLTCVYDGASVQIVNFNPSFIPAGLIVPYTASGTFTVPGGVYLLRRVRLWGGGGGGGGSSGAGGNSAVGAGGGAGAYVEFSLRVTPGQIIPVTVGAGGNGGGNLSSGNPGTATSFGSYAVAGAGSGGGSSNSGVSSNPGTPGTVTLGNGVSAFVPTPSGGGIGYLTSSGYASGLGGSSYTTSTNQPSVGAGGYAGSFPGNGGNGSSSGSYAAGAGAAGLVIVEY